MTPIVEFLSNTHNRRSAAGGKKNLYAYKTISAIHKRKAIGKRYFCLIVRNTIQNSGNE